MSLSQRDAAVIWHPYTQTKNSDLPVAIVRGEGAHLFDEQNNLYIDAISSWWVNTHGHAHPHIAEKVYEQLKTLEHVIFAGFTHEPAINLAERLLKILPDNQSRIFYSDNGSTAVEVALKMAFQYWQNTGQEKKKIIAFHSAYHGDTFGAMSVSERSAFTRPFFPFLFDIIFIDLPVKGKEELTKSQLNECLKNNDIAAFIFEPLVQGAAGMVMYAPEILDELIVMCQQKKVLTIADEVFTGFGRTGKFFAIDHLSQQPDIMCLSKGLTGGTLPLGVTSSTSEIYNAFISDDSGKTFFHGHSFTGNPIGCAAALAGLDLFEKTDTWKNISRISNKHESFREDLLRNYSDLPTGGKFPLKEIRQTGTILALEIDTYTETSYFSEIRNTIYAFFMEKKIILRPLGNIIYIVPPYCISDEDLDYIYNSIKEFLSTLHDKLKK